jgi:hypothetical protein
MAKVLITQALSAAAHRFKKQFTADNLLMGDFADVPDVMLRSGSIKKLPAPQSPSYPHQILTFCLDNNVSTVYALNIDEFEALQPAVQLFSEYGINIQLIKNDL